MTQSRDFLTHLVAHDAVLVTVHRHRGSVPRELGAWMAVFADCIVGTVGGGHLEWQAIGEARARLQGAAGAAVLRYALGPRLGPVSYTHLDVYKRQGSRWPGSAR